PRSRASAGAVLRDRRTPRRSVNGRVRTATRCRRAAGSRSTSPTPTTPPSRGTYARAPTRELSGPGLVWWAGHGRIGAVQVLLNVGQPRLDGHTTDAERAVPPDHLRGPVSSIVEPVAGVPAHPLEPNGAS